MEKKFYNPPCVPGTARQIMPVKDGVALQRAWVYLPAESWDKLRAMGIQHGVSNSVIIERLIKIASAA